MRHVNFLYWIIFPLTFWALYTLNSSTISRPESFLGFAESRQIDLNLPLDVMIDSVFVQPGDVVKSGAPLLRVSSKSNELEELKATLQKSVLEVKKSWTHQELKTKKASVISERDQAIAALQSKKDIKSKEIATYQSLLSTTAVKSSEELDALELEITKVRESYRRQILEIDKLISMQSEEDAEKKLMTAELESLGKAREDFLLRAPFDGVVGNIAHQHGEHKEAFTSLATLFAVKPTMVTGYIDERYEVAITNGDSVKVQSAFLNKGEVSGLVTKKGNRIIEIPEKCSQTPGIKRYGIEVFIEIPIENQFLQKEVLQIGVYR
jgi:multidrug resistance efflux pump